MFSPVAKIAIVGPESTGKTTLTRALANYYQTAWVEEIARAYLDSIHRDYEQYDLVEIARQQIDLEEKTIADAQKALFTDTNLLVLKIWSEVKYGECDPWILDHMNLESYQLHILAGTDIPWEFDPQREHPGHRDELYQIYRDHLVQAGVPFLEVKGPEAERLEASVKMIDTLI